MPPLREKFYFLAPTTEAPVNGPIFLGAIITHPKNADAPLNSSPIPINSSSMPIYPNEIENYTLTVERDSTGTLGVWASFLAQILGIGGDVTGEIGGNDSETWACKKLKTLWFNPTADYIKESLEHSAVKAFLKENPDWLRSSKVYMVTGLKLAYGASGAMTWARNKGINLHVGIDATSVGVPVEAGPELGAKRKDKVEQKFGEKTPFVLAFRMRKITVSWSGAVSEKPVTGGLLGIDDQRVEGSGQQEQAAFVVKGLEEVDADADDFEIDDSWEVFEKDGDVQSEKCGCALVSDS